MWQRFDIFYGNTFGFPIIVERTIKITEGVWHWKGGVALHNTWALQRPRPCRISPLSAALELLSLARDLRGTSCAGKRAQNISKLKCSRSQCIQWNRKMGHVAWAWIFALEKLTMIILDRLLIYWTTLLADHLSNSMQVRGNPGQWKFMWLFRVLWRPFAVIAPRI